MKRLKGRKNTSELPKAKGGIYKSSCFGRLYPAICVFSRSRRRSTSNCQITAFQDTPFTRACWGWREHPVTKLLKCDPASFMMKRYKSVCRVCPCSAHTQLCGSVGRLLLQLGESSSSGYSHNPQISHWITPKVLINVCFRCLAFFQVHNIAVLYTALWEKNASAMLNFQVLNAYM